MGGGAVSANVPTNQNTQQSANNTFGSVNNFGSMPNYALESNNAYTPNVFSQNLFSPTNFNPQSLVNAGNNMSDIGGQVSNQSQNLYGMGNDAFAVGADPNLSQYNYYDKLLTDSMNAENSAAGIGSTPYGAYVTDSANASFTNQWAMNESSKLNAALQAASGAYGQGASGQATGAGLMGAGQSLAASGPAFSSQELSQLLSALEQNYAFPQQNITNQLGYMSGANAQNQTAIQSAQQQTMANYMNSPFAFLGALGGAFAPKVSLTAPLSSTPLLG